VLNCPRPRGPLVGTWKGTLDVNRYKLRLLFHVEKSPGGKITAHLVSPDQGSTNIAVDSVFLGLASNAKFGVRSIQGTYRGKLSGHRIVGVWQQRGGRFPLVLEKIDAARFLAEQSAWPPAAPESVAVMQKSGGRLVGEWTGELEDKKPRRLTIKLAEQAGGLTGTLESPDQWPGHIPLTKLSLGKTDFIFDFDTVNGHFIANWDANGNLAGQWDQGGSPHSLVMQRSQ